MPVHQKTSLKWCCIFSFARFLFGFFGPLSIKGWPKDTKTSRKKAHRGNFYWTHVFIGSDLWVLVSLGDLVETSMMWLWLIKIPTQYQTGYANMTIPGNMVMQVAKFKDIASGATWCPNLYEMQGHFWLEKFFYQTNASPSGTTNFKLLQVTKFGTNTSPGDQICNKLQ